MLCLFCRGPRESDSIYECFKCWSSCFNVKPGTITRKNIGDIQRRIERLNCPKCKNRFDQGTSKASEFCEICRQSPF